LYIPCPCILAISYIFSIICSSSENPFKLYHTRRKRPSPYCNPFLPYILIPYKIKSRRLLKISEELYFIPL
jgi:hypothetical protein